MFRLFGYAGVGKTTLARHIAEGARGETAFAAFTGKAALVMRSKGCAGATTIHALIYRATEGAEGAPTFTLNADGPASRAGLIVIDECSMVDAELARDLLSFGKPILVLGDPFQLPPVKGGGYFTDGAPDVMLTQIHRQAQDNPIIRLSEVVRSGGELKEGVYGETRIIRRAAVDAAQVLGADQVLVGVNRTRRAYNQRMRDLNGFKEPLPVAGDRLVCLRNDRTKGLINGGLWRVETLGGVAKDFVKMTLRSGGRRRPLFGQGRSFEGLLRGDGGRARLCAAARVGRVRLRLRADGPQGPGVTVGQRHAVRRKLRLPRAPRALALYGAHARGADG